MWIRFFSRGPGWVALTSLFGFLFVVVTFAPGLMSVDSMGQLSQARSGEFNDWHPPLMGLLWRFLDKIYPGPSLMLVFHNLLFWSGLAAVAHASWRSKLKWAPVFVLAVGFAPPIVALLGTIWKDVGLGVALVAATGLLLRAHLRFSWPSFSIALVLLVYASMVRHNAPAALFPFYIWVGWLVVEQLKWKNRLLRLACAVLAGPLFLLVFGLLGASINSWLTQGRSLYPIQQILLHDLTAISLQTGKVSLPPYLESPGDPYTLDLLKRLYSRSEVVPMFCCNDAPKHFPISDDKTQVDQLKAKWYEVVSQNMGPYVQHRWRVFKQQLGMERPKVCYPYHTGVEENTLGVSFRSNRLHRWLAPILEDLKDSFIFRGWFWALFNFILLGYGLRHLRFHRTDEVSVRSLMPGLVLGLSGILYLLPYFFVSTTCDFRMQWWTVLATCMAAPLLVRHRELAAK